MSGGGSNAVPTPPNEIFDLKLPSVERRSIAATARPLITSTRTSRPWLVFHILLER